MKNQQRVKMVLESKSIDHEVIHIDIVSGAKDEMRNICNDPKALPIQIVKDGVRLGNYDDFDMAVEDDNLKGFLKLE